jgi:predicted PurR-regulated permease PerM
MSKPTRADKDPSDASRSSSGPTPSVPGVPVAIRSFGGWLPWGLLLVLTLRYLHGATFIVLATLAAAALAATLRPLFDRLPGPAPLRALAFVALLALSVALPVLGLGWALYDPIRTNIAQLPELRDRFNEGLQQVAGRLGISTELDVAGLAEIAGRLLTGESMTNWISNVADGLLATLLAVLVVTIAATYLLATPGTRLSAEALRLLPPPRREPTRKALEQLQPQLRWWAVGTAFSMALIALASGLGFWLVGLEFALPLALFAGVAQSVPTFGPLLTLLLSLVVAATQGLPQVIGVVGVYIVVQSLESYVLTPLVMKRAVNVPPVVTLLTIILWGNVFGLAGLVLAIPIDLTIWAFLRNHIIEARDEGPPATPSPT